MEFDLSFIPSKPTVEDALAKLYRGVRETNSFLGLDIQDKDLQDTYTRLVKEEVSEIFEATEKQDFGMFIDGVVDSLVVASYLMSRACPEPEDFIDISLYEPMLFCLEALSAKDIKEPEDEADDLYYLENIFAQLPIDHMKAAETVLASNWSKFPLLSDTINPEKELADIEAKGRYSDLTYEVRKDSNGNDRYIFWAGSEYGVKYPTQKYVKPSSFIEPDFKSCILN